VKVLVIAGSLRTASLNRKLAKLAAEYLRGKGHEVDELDLRQVEMPIYDGDLESSSGLPEGAKAFRARIAAAQAIFLASPEYNNGVPGGMKNAIDWASRGADQPLKGKVIALAGASPGAYGTTRALTSWRMIFRLVEAFVIPPELALPLANKAFDEHGAFIEDRPKKQLGNVLDELVRVASALGSAQAQPALP
jgi:chromate reductase, NAD(P)H dehydrogenase (quinone)